MRWEEKPPKLQTEERNRSILDSHFPVYLLEFKEPFWRAEQALAQDMPRESRGSWAGVCDELLSDRHSGIAEGTLCIYSLQLSLAPGRYLN